MLLRHDICKDSFPQPSLVCNIYSNAGLEGRRVAVDLVQINHNTFQGLQTSLEKNRLLILGMSDPGPPTSLMAARYIVHSSALTLTRPFNRG
jgi:hypothetical protein